MCLKHMNWSCDHKSRFFYNTFGNSLCFAPKTYSNVKNEMFCKFRFAPKKHSIHVEIRIFHFAPKTYSNDENVMFMKQNISFFNFNCRFLKVHFFLIWRQEYLENRLCKFHEILYRCVFYFDACNYMRVKAHLFWKFFFGPKSS